MGSGWILVPVIVVPIAATLALCVGSLKTCPPNHLMVVFGKLRGGKAHVVLEEGSRIVWPIIQDFVYISRSPLNVTDEEGRSIAVVRVGADEERMENTAIQLAGRERDEIARMARDVLESTGHPDDPDATESELRKLGLVLLKS